MSECRRSAPWRRGSAACPQSGRKGPRCDCLLTGPASSEIVYQPKPKPSAIALDAFVQLAKHPQDDVVLVDLRNPIEVEEPSIDHVVNIPFDMIPERMETLTSGPTPVFFCPTGARAEMAHNLVTAAGGESRFLASGAVVGRDGGLKSTRPWWAPKGPSANNLHVLLALSPAFFVAARIT